MKDRNKWMLILFCSLMVLSALLSSLFHAEEPPAAPEGPPAEHFAPRQRPVSDVNPARDFSNALADAVEKVMPSVVVIRTERVQYQKRPVDLFGFYYQVVPEQLAGEGSGVIIDERGDILTSGHVVEGARQIEVVLNDGTKLPAELVGQDKATDLAVVRIKDGGRGDFPAIEFGDSDKARVGEVVIAIGSPFSLQSSVTIGHISQKGRRIKILPYEDFIQTDAAINEGNSGGPLIDVDGRLVGINAAIKTDEQRRGVGIAFAVPSNLSMGIAKSLIETGKHEWPWVGAFFETIDPAYRKKLFDGAGVVVSQVWNGTPAAEAAIQPGDLVLEVAGTKVNNKYDVDRIIYNHSVGERVPFLLKQGREQREVELKLEEYPGVVY